MNIEKVSDAYRKDSIIRRGYEVRKRNIFEPLTDKVLSAVFFGQIPVINNDLEALKLFINGEYRKLIAKELGISPILISDSKLSKRDEVATEYLIRNVGEIFKQRLASEEDLASNISAKKVENKGYGWNKIEEMLRQASTPSSSRNEMEDNRRMKEIRDALIYRRNFAGKKTITEIARDLKMSTTKLNTMDNDYDLDGKNNLIPKETAEKRMKKESKGGQEVDLDEVRNALILNQRGFKNRIIADRLSKPVGTIETWFRKYTLDVNKVIVPKQKKGVFTPQS